MAAGCTDQVSDFRNYLHERSEARSYQCERFIDEPTICYTYMDLNRPMRIPKMLCQWVVLATFVWFVWR